MPNLLDQVFDGTAPADSKPKGSVLDDVYGEETSAPKYFSGTPAPVTPDTSKLQISPEQEQPGAMNAPFEEYAALHPTHWQVQAYEYLKTADTPEKKELVARYIQDSAAPENPVNSVLGDALMSSMQGPMVAFGVNRGIEEIHKLQQEHEEQRQRYNEILKKHQELLNKGLKPEADPSTLDKIGRLSQGVAESVVGLVDFFGSPFGVITGGLGAIPESTAAQKPVLRAAINTLQQGMELGFGAQMASAMPNEVAELYDEVRKPEDQRDWTKIGRLSTGLVSSGAFATLATKHGLRTAEDRRNDWWKANTLSPKDLVNRQMQQLAANVKGAQFDPYQTDLRFDPSRARWTADQRPDQARGPGIDITPVKPVEYERESDDPEQNIQMLKDAGKNIVPAVLHNGQIIVGQEGDTHNAIGERHNIPSDVMADDDNRVFVMVDEKNKRISAPMNRVDAAETIAFDKPLHSEDLIKLNKEVSDAIQKPSAAAVPVQPAPQAAPPVEVEPKVAPTKTVEDVKAKHEEGLDTELVDIINSPSTMGQKSHAIKKAATARGISVKEMQEQVEAHVVRMADAISRDPRYATPEEKFLELQRLYERQPKFSARTSTSVADQAYSTPIPLAYALNHAVGEGLGAYEPTAGNGALMIGDDLSKSHANEKNQTRADNLKANKVATVTQNDATKFQPREKFDRVKANPPFGSIDNVNYEGYGIKRLEHLISIKALEAMKDDGAGYIILGAALHSSDTGKGAQRVFENYLYSRYNVVGNFEVAGDLYSAQGASFPVRVIVVDGRREKPLEMGEHSPKSVQRLTSWGEVWKESERIKNEIESRRKGMVSGGETAIPVRVEEKPKHTEVRGATAKPASEVAGAVGEGGERGGTGVSEPVSGKQPPGDGENPSTAKTSERSEVSERPTETAGGTELPAGRVEGSDVGVVKAPFDAGERTDVGSGEPITGVVSKPPSVIKGELEALDDIDGLIQGAMDANEQKATGHPAEKPAAVKKERKPREKKPAPVETPATAEPVKSATDIIREAAKHGVSGIDESIKSIHEILGGTRMGIKPQAFNQVSYDRMKPHLEKAWSEFEKAGKSLKEYAQFVLKNFTNEAATYLKRFLEEKKDEPVKAPDPKEPPKVKAAEFQVAYEPRSEATPFGTLIPKSISGGVHAYLDDLKTRVGSLDEFVAKEVDMPVDQLRRVAAAEQIDGAAMAIDQMKNGGATIVGDQTGIGKGRQAALVLRWALNAGKIPVFFTKDPKLFSDMFGDLSDVYEILPKELAATFKPLILGDVGKASIVDTEGNVIHRSPNKKAQDAAIANILNNGLTSSGYNAIFATYSQVNARNARQMFLERLASDNPMVLVLDEAHDASGNAENTMQAAFFQGGRVKRGSGADIKYTVVPGLLNAAGTKADNGGGVMYLSATYAKRPENMPVYFRTSLQKAADNFPQIVDAMNRGGVALQQAVTEALAKAGQYTRRERDFTGVSYNMLPVSVADKSGLIDHVDQVTDVLQQIVEFSEYVRGVTEGSTAMTGTQMDMTDFASVVHNQIGQLLLAAKADAVVEEAIKAHKAGEKPVIALMSTMEAFLDKFVEYKGIKSGEEIQLRWNELLKHALSRTLRVSEELPNGDPIVRDLQPSDLGEAAEALYRSIEEAADGIESKFPVSPIDCIIQKLAANGVKVAELTGRKSGIKYTDFENGKGTYVKFPSAKKNKVVNGFNSGEHDGMLLNASGSTGLSAHASQKFKDQKPRHMLIAQPAADITVFVQTLGRIFRTGLVMKGMDEAGKPYGAKYSHLVLPLQAELRPAAMAARKMKSLNANTTAEADNAIKIESEDFLNKYGDAIVAEYLDQHHNLQDKLGLYIELKEDGTPETQRDLASRFTGRMSRMPDDWQRAAYEEIIPAYREFIQQLKNTGEYDLEIVTHDDWDGVRQSDEQLAAGTDESNIFTASVQMQEWNVSDKRHVPTGEEMQREFEKNHGTPQKLQSDFDLFASKVNERMQQRADEYATKLSDPNLNEIDRNKIENAQKLHQEAMRRWNQDTSSKINRILNTAGKVITLNNAETGETYDGMLVGFREPTSTNRVAPSAFRYKFMLDAPGGVVYITGSQFNSEKWSFQEAYRTPDELKGGHRENRYTRHFIVGNPIRAYTATGGSGKMVRFKSREGETVTGLLMPRNWGPENLASDPRLDLTNGKAVSHFLSNYSGFPLESGGVARIERQRWSSGYEISTGAARRAGGNIYLDPKLLKITGDFTKVGNRMKVSIDSSQLEEAADAIRAITGAPFRPSGKAERLLPAVEESNKEGGSTGKRNLGPSMGAMTPSAKEEQRTFTGAVGIKNSAMKKLAGELGLNEYWDALEESAKGHDQVWQDAIARLDNEWDWPDKIIEDIKRKPRTLSDEEEVALNYRLVDLKLEHGKLSRDMMQAYEDAKSYPERLDDARALQIRISENLDKVQELMDVTKTAGREWGRSGNMRRRMMKADYSLLQMEVNKRTDNGGRPLSEKEHIQIRELHEKIKNLRDEYNKFVQESQAKITELEAKTALDDIISTTTVAPKIEPHIIKLAEKIVAKADKEANDALERIKARWNGTTQFAMSGGVNPDDFNDVCIYVAGKILKGTVKSAEWTAEMVSQFGKGIKPHLDKIWAKAELISNKHISSETNPKDEVKVRKIVKRQPKDVTDRIGGLQERISEQIYKGGKKSITQKVQKLARLYVEDGVTDREELIDRVHEFLLDADPTITRQEAMDAISGRGIFHRPRQDEVSKTVRDLKEQIRLVSHQMDVVNKNPLPRTGFQRDPMSEDARLELQKLNKLMRDNGVVVTDPNTQLMGAAQKFIRRANNRIADLNRKLEEKDFAPRPRKEELILDEEGRKKKAELERVIKEYERGRLLDRQKYMTATDKIAYYWSKIRRAEVLSSPMSVLKLISAAVQSIAFSVADEGAGTLWSKLLPGLAEKATIEGGGLNVQMEAKALTKGLMESIDDIKKNFKMKQGDLEVLYGRENLFDSHWLDYQNFLHSALKSPAKRVAFERAMQKQIENGIRNGVDVNDDLVKLGYGVRAYKAGNYNIFRGENWVTKAYRAALQKLTTPTKESKTAEQPYGRSPHPVAAALIRTEFPIVDVPTNMAFQVFERVFGVPMGLSKLGSMALMKALGKQVSELSPDEADIIMRNLKRGSLGGAMFALGYFNPQTAGGFYQPGQKQKPDEIKYGTMKIGGMVVEEYLLHSPAMLAYQFGATVRLVQDQLVNKYGEETKGFTRGMAMALFGMVEAQPFVREMLDFARIHSWKSFKSEADRQAVSLVVPQISQWAARQTDTDEAGEKIKRYPRDTKEAFEAAIPGLRQNVPSNRNVFSE